MPFREYGEIEEKALEIVYASELFKTLNQPFFKGISEYNSGYWQNWTNNTPLLSLRQTTRKYTYNEPKEAKGKAFNLSKLLKKRLAMLTKNLDPELSWATLLSFEINRFLSQTSFDVFCQHSILKQILPHANVCQPADIISIASGRIEAMPYPLIEALFLYLAGCRSELLVSRDNSGFNEQKLCDYFTTQANHIGLSYTQIWPQMQAFHSITEKRFDYSASQVHAFFYEGVQAKIPLKLVFLLDDFFINYREQIMPQIAQLPYAQLNLAGDWSAIFKYDGKNYPTLGKFVDALIENYPFAKVELCTQVNLYVGSEQGNVLEKIKDFKPITYAWFNDLIERRQQTIHAVRLNALRQVAEPHLPQAQQLAKRQAKFKMHNLFLTMPTARIIKRGAQIP